MLLPRFANNQHTKTIRISSSVQVRKGVTKERISRNKYTRRNSHTRVANIAEEVINDNLVTGIINMLNTPSQEISLNMNKMVHLYQLYGHGIDDVHNKSMESTLKKSNTTRVNVAEI